ncbi:MAG: bifunctional precorrin-2 dehydrogenase/sirohydrochlorin ferrochelatase [Desulfovermiculus sp.]|nr:bifunctional precorrin-2 dehydrogenase/sirohydrochlorin ferrochelatase [Desulfovermiculus sp.]
MPNFPAFLDLRGRRCLVVGAGRVGTRKIRRLVHCRAHPLEVVEPQPDKSLTKDPQICGAITLHRRPYDPGDLPGAFLVVASTSNPELNTRIGRLCQEKDILCNVVDHPELCSLVWPSLISKGDLQIAVSTGGASPALARRIQRELDHTFGPEYETWLNLLQMLRPYIIARSRPQTENAAIFRSLTDQELLEAISRANGSRLLALLEERLPQDLHSFAREVLHELEFVL